MKKVLGVFSLVMINIIAVDSLRSLPFSAEYGLSLIFYYLLAAVVFFLPVALVSAELATAFPTKGGIYVWIREAFGEFWGFFIIWMQWVYNVAWYPTILSFVAGAIAFVIHPSLAENRLFILTTVMAIFWGATFINFFGMRTSSWISTAGALLGTLLPMAVVTILGVVWVSMGKPIQIEFKMGDLMPNFADLERVSFLIALLFGLVGIEMSAVHADEVKDPGHAYPRAILYSTVIILGSLILSSLAIAIVVPRNDLSVYTGLLQALKIFLTTFHVPWVLPIITFLIILGGISSVATWIIGPTKGLLVASQDGSAPKFFGHTNNKEVPVIILIIQASIFTLLCSIFVLMPSVSSSYWVLTAITAQLAMIVYIVLFVAAIYLRYSKPDVARGYKIPFGNVGIWVVGIFGIASCVFAIFLGFVPPKSIDIGSIIVYESILVIGMALLTLPPVVIYLRNKRRSRINKLNLNS